MCVGLFGAAAIFNKRFGTSGLFTTQGGGGRDPLLASLLDGIGLKVRARFSYKFVLLNINCRLLGKFYFFNFFIEKFDFI